ncbi:MAG: A24 family peptidase [Pseudomonadota bacterium]
MNVVTALQASPTTLYILLFVLGACIGSFLNVVVLRLPKRLQFQWESHCRDYFVGEAGEYSELPEEPPDLVTTPSHCPQCKSKIKPWHNVPILGYLFLRGKCANCSQRISPRYPVVELATGLFTVHAAFFFPVSLQLIAALILIWTLITLSLIDADCQLLPDDLTIPLLWMGLFVNLWSTFTSIHSAVIGAIVGYLSLWILFQVHFRITGKQGMGYGDFKLLAAIGAWLGWQSLPLVALLASLAGTLFALGLILTRRQSREIPISFGPFLALGAWIALFWGDQLVTNYLALLKF